MTVQIQTSMIQNLLLITHKVITSSAQSAAKPQQNWNSTGRAEVRGTVRAGPQKCDGDPFVKVNFSPS